MDALPDRHSAVALSYFAFAGSREVCVFHIPCSGADPVLVLSLAGYGQVSERDRADSGAVTECHLADSGADLVAVHLLFDPEAVAACHLAASGAAVVAVHLLSLSAIVSVTRHSVFVTDVFFLHHDTVRGEEFD